jgi:hypothetical protein
MKVGIEVEGRFKGLKTLFVDYSELYSDDVNAVADEYNCQQIYISDLTNYLDLSEDLTYINDKFIITIERTVISNKVNPRLNIMLHIENESFWLLKPNDQIKFSREQFVFATPKDTMFVTLPTDFDQDINV